MRRARGWRTICTLPMPRRPAAWPVDGATLADLSDAQPLPLDAPAWAASGNGSTLASLVETRRGRAPADEVSVLVRDARTGSEPSRFHAPIHLVGPALNRDGSVLV